MSSTTSRDSRAEALGALEPESTAWMNDSTLRRMMMPPKKKKRRLNISCRTAPNENNATTSVAALPETTNGSVAGATGGRSDNRALAPRQDNVSTRVHEGQPKDEDDDSISASARSSQNENEERRSSQNENEERSTARPSLVALSELVDESVASALATLDDSISTCWELGVSNFWRENLDQALAFFNSVLLMEQGQGCNLDVADTLRSIGAVHHRKGDLDQALQLYRRSIELAKHGLTSTTKKPPGDDKNEVVFQGLLLTGLALSEQNQTEQAFETYQDALELGRGLFGDEHLYIATAFRLLGRLHDKPGDLESLEKAADFYERALEAQCAALEPGHPDIRATKLTFARVAFSLSRICGDLERQHRAEAQRHEDLARQQERKAMLCCDELLARAGRQGSRSDLLEVARAMCARADGIQHHESFVDVALENYTKALAVQKEHSADRLVIAATLNGLGRANFRSGDYEGAMDALQECIQIRREAGVDDDEGAALNLADIAKSMIHLDRRDMALDVLLEAYRISASLDAPDKNLLFIVLYDIACIYEEQGHHEQALAFYGEAARVVGADVYDETSYNISPQYKMGCAYYQLDDMDLAFDSFSKALAIELVRFGSRDPTIATTLTWIGNVELRRGHVDNAMTKYVDAARIYREAGESVDQDEIDVPDLWRLEVIFPPAAGAA